MKSFVVKTSIYISSACAGLVTSLPFPPADLRPRTSGSAGPETRAESFPDRLPSEPVLSGGSIGSWRIATASGGPDWPSSKGGDEESDRTAGTSASSAVGWETEGSVRMFLEITPEGL